MELLIAFVFGMVVMDFLWAWRLGIPQMLWAHFKYRRALKKNPNFAEWSED